MHKKQVITSKLSRFSDVKVILKQIKIILRKNSNVKLIRSSQKSTFTNITKRHFWLSRKNMRNQAKIIKNFAHNIYASYASQYVCSLKVFESFGGK